MTIDMSKYLGLFTSEATEHLEQLSQELVRLEREGGAEVVDSMFRHAHSVKGMAASMGFEGIATLSHRVEDLVDQVRKRPEVMSPEIADVLFAATDHLQAMVRCAGAGEAPPDASPLIGRISERLVQLTGAEPAATRVIKTSLSSAGTPAVPAAATQATPAAMASPAAHPTGPEMPARFAVKVKLATGCKVPGVRGFLVQKKLGSLGNVFDLTPALDDLKAGRIPDGLITMQVETPSAEAIQKALAVVADLESVEVSRIEQKAAPVRPPEPAPEPSRAVGAEPNRTVRVKTEILDYFLDVVGELLLSTSRLREVSKSVPESLQPPLLEGVDRVRSIAKELHNKVMSVRMTPLSLITDRLPRAARDIARKMGREVDLVITGAEIELDRAILDELADPLLHILRNCLDHGLEEPAERERLGKGARGRIVVAARRDRDRVLLEIEDDGRGMDAARLKAKALERGLITAEAAAAMGDHEAWMLSCLPGISTAEAVTDVSGRGVGMDAVKRAVENVGGNLDIASTPGRGTRFTLRLPLTVAVVNVLLVGVGREVFGLPIAKVASVIETEPSSLERSRNVSMLPWSGTLLPVYPLGEMLQIARLPAGGPRPHVVIETDPGRVALEVDRLYGQEEAVLKPLSRPLDLVPGLAGVTILGSGRPIFILDVPRLLAA